VKQFNLVMNSEYCSLYKFRRSQLVKSNKRIDRLIDDEAVSNTDGD